MSRSIRWRALLAAALLAAVAAFALPSAADAATAEVVNASGNGILGYSAAGGEINNVRVSVANGKLVISDAAPITAGNGCTVNVQGDAECSIGVTSILMHLGDKSDTVQYTAPHGGGVFGGDGADTIFGGLRQAALGRPIEPVSYDGKDRRNDPVNDTVSYRFADRGVQVDLADAAGPNRLSNDGRPGDREHIESDIEVIEGSNFGDTMFGSDRDEVMRGLNGEDTVGAGGGSDIIDEGSAPNGADVLNGGNGGNDRITYGTRASGVNTSLDGVRNDGAPGERDDVRPNVENIMGTNHDDTLTGNSLANTIEGFGGVDTIDGGGNDDTLAGGLGADTLLGSSGNDVIRAKDGIADIVGCGTEIDTAELDTNLDAFDASCENRPVGTLRLTPKTLRADTGELVRSQLSWRHPRTWRQLRTIELRLTSDGMPVGEITIRPRGERITDDGAVTLVRRGTRLTRRGKTVAARLALRLDQSLAGQTLEAEVEATDRRGRRQLERDAGRIRVSG